MAFQFYLTSLMTSAPLGTAPVSVTPSSSSWANSSWVEVITSTSSAILLTGLRIITAGVAGPFEVEVGVGGAGAESPVTLFRGTYDDAGFHGRGTIPHLIPLDNIPTSTRVSIRMRKNGTNTTAWKFALQYLAKPVTGVLLTTAQTQKCYPPAANDLTINSSSVAWTNPASFTTIVSSTAAAIVVVGVVVPFMSNGIEWELDLATGAAASEVVVTRMRNKFLGVADGPEYISLGIPFDNIGSGVRLSGRFRTSVTGVTAKLAVVYHEKPL